MRRLLLYPFRYRDDATGKWVDARYVAELHEIEARHAEWKLTGPPEVRELAGSGRYFTPYKLVAHAELKTLSEPPPTVNPHLERPPAIDVVERYLVALFLRRYVTYCARRGRFAQMQGAARLRREVVQSREPGPVAG